MIFVVVDNCKIDLDLLEKIIALAVPGSQIYSFTDPLLSAKYVCNNPVDIVLIADAMYPVDGFQLLQVLRKNVPDLAAVILSNSIENKINAIRVGATDYILKPVSANVLISVIEQLSA